MLFSDDVTMRNYLNDKEVVALISLGVPCGAIQAVYNGKDLSHGEEHRLSDKQLAKVRHVYVPINSLKELAEHRAMRLSSYTINPTYMPPRKVQSFMYRFELLTDIKMNMFDINDVNNHQIEMLNNIPLTYEKLEKMKNKYITPEIEKQYIENNKNKGLTSERFYELLNEDACKGVGNMFLDLLDERDAEMEEEFE